MAPMKRKPIRTRIHPEEMSMYFPHTLRQGSDPEMILEPARLLLVSNEPQKSGPPFVPSWNNLAQRNLKVIP